MDKSASQMYIAHFCNPKTKLRHRNGQYFVLYEYFSLAFKQIQLLSREVWPICYKFLQFGKLKI